MKILFHLVLGLALVLGTKAYAADKCQTTFEQHLEFLASQKTKIWSVNAIVLKKIQEAGNQNRASANLPPLDLSAFTLAYGTVNGRIVVVVSLFDKDNCMILESSGPLDVTIWLQFMKQAGFTMQDLVEITGM